MRRGVGAILAGAAWLALPGSASAATPAVQEGDEETRYFALPLARDARTLAQHVEEHLAAARWSEGIALLQRLIEEHGAEVLPDEYRASAAEFSAHAAHPGAATWARRRLGELPTQARRLYRDRFEGHARESVDQARVRGDRRALVEVARRWPLTRSAGHAYWILGDLELEEGHARGALVAWSRAEELSRLVEAEVPAGTDARRRLALDVLARTEGAQRASPGGVPLPPLDLAQAIGPVDPGRSRGPLPSSAAEPWTRELDLEPFDRASDPAPYYHSLVPTLAGERVLASSTLRVFCVDAFTGEVEWRTLPPDGWDLLSARRREMLFKGINRPQLLVKPAVGGGIAVAALQIPYSEEGTENWQGIEIMRAISQRRLFAFDLETGDELWSHAPELEWVPAASRFRMLGPGDYEEQMLVAGPPVIAGSRVLVPCYRMEGRIDYHVACYELESGERLWSTSVVSGQRPRNMFGRARQEFAASPLVVAGDSVIAQTDLGTVAALDLLTGEIRWESLYRQIALPKTRSYSTPDRHLTWRLAPPAVVGDLVISTPSDSDEIAAFRLSDGRVEWTWDERQLQETDPDTRHLRFNLLLGADPATIYLSGQKVAALQKPGGLESSLPFEALWTRALEDDQNPDRVARPLLCRDAVLVPMRNERLVLDRRSGVELRLQGGPWDYSSYGNALVDDGVIFTLSREELHGFFDWDALLERQRRRLLAEPGDPDVALDAATLYARRADAVFEEGEPFAALGFLQAAREILEPLVRRLEVSAAGRPREKRRAREELHRVLRREALVLEAQGNRARALEALARARGLASSRTALRDTLLHEERILRASNRRAEHLSVLAELERRCGDLPLTSEFLVGDGSALSGLDRYTQASLHWSELDLPVGLWVLFNRADAARRQRSIAEAMDDWHAVLARFGGHEVAPGLMASDLAREAIGRELLLPDGRLAYDRFESAAEGLLSDALASGDAARLREVSLLYPHSLAAREADRARLELAFERADAEAVSSIVYASLIGPAEPTADHPALLRLARTLGRLGNAELERELLAELVREAPAALSDLPEHGGRPLAEVLEGLRQLDAPQSPLAPRFDEDLVTGATREGAFRYVGRLLPRAAAEAAPEELHVYLVQDRIEAFSSSGREGPTWRHPLREPAVGSRACAVSGERVLVGGRTALVALDARGQPVWTRPTGGISVQNVVVANGVAVALVGATDPERALAFDAHAGVPLWELHLGAEGRWRPPIIGSGRAIFFSQVYSKPARALVVDLFRGTPVAEAELGSILNNDLDESAWIEARTLLVPDFTQLRRRSRVSAYDLDTGELRLERELPDGQMFHSIAHADGDDYLVTIAEGVGGGGAIYAFDGEYGTLQQIVPLRIGEWPMGLEPRTRTELEAPYLFTFTKTSSNRGVPVRAIHLPYGARWTWSLPVAHDELYDSDVMPVPVTSEDCVALAYVTKHPSTGLRGDAWMVFVDKHAGKQLGQVLLDEELALADRIELRGLGESLFVVGRANRRSGLRLQVWEPKRIR